MLVAERDWVEVEADGDGLEGWGRGGKGVGLIAVLGVVVCYVSSTGNGGADDRPLLCHFLPMAAVIAT